MADLTTGQKLVGFNFNPSGDRGVNELKSLYAKIIDICIRGATTGPENQRRLFQAAVDHAITAQMWAVKAQTWKE